MINPTISLKINQYDRSFKHLQLSQIASMITGGFSADLINQIRSEPDKKIRTSLKAHLPMFYPCSFLCASASMDEVAEHSGLMVFDVDNITSEQAENYKRTLMESDFRDNIVLMFISPSGGLKFLLQTDFTYEHGDDELDEYQYCNDWHRYAYKQIQAQLVDIGLPDTELDSSTCNINRGTYLSVDSLCLFNPYATTLSIMQYRAAFDSDQAEYSHKLSNECNATLKKNGAVWDEDKARQSMERVYYEMTSQMKQGNRHTLIFKLLCSAYDRGFDQYNVMEYLYRLQAAGHYTESMSPAHKAIDAYRCWQRDSKRPVILQHFTKFTLEQSTASMHQLLRASAIRDGRLQP